MKKRFSRPQIVAKLRQADILIGQGKAAPAHSINPGLSTSCTWQPFSSSAK